MSDLNLQLVREFFELNRFHVMTHWQHQDLPRPAEAGSLLFVEHPEHEGEPAPDFLLDAGGLHHIHRAVVEVRAWHTDRFYPSLVERNTVLAHVVEKDTLALADSVFGSPGCATILVISELPSSTEPRQRAIELLQKLAIGHIIEFPTILGGILEHITAHGVYAPSQTLQTMRLLKRYDLIRRQQLEFTFPIDTPKPAQEPVVHTQVLPDPGDGDEE